MTTSSETGERASADEARRFAAAFRSFLEWIHTPDAGIGRNEVSDLVADFLGAAGVRESVVSKTFSPFDHVNLQTALNAWAAEDGRTVDIRGVALPPHFSEITLEQLISGEGLPPLHLSAPPLVDLPNGPESTLACLRRALLLVTDATGRYMLYVAGPSEHTPTLQVDVAGLPVATAQRVLADLDALRSRLNVYRGQLLEVGPTPNGIALHFAQLPATPRADVILSEDVLGRLERHSLGVAEHRDGLLAAGQHLKRGLLLYGPPGTGKTHTMRYLVAQMSGYTRLVMTGQALHAIGSVAELARELEPAVIVLEDVDLVAEDRSFGFGGNPILFELLNAMDGAAADADLLFVLTTNRADLLEHALAARPGRVDVAVEIPLPDESARGRLLELYTRDVPTELTDADIAETVERTDGVTASFIKELVRRAVLESLREESTLRAVTAAQLRRGLDDLLDSTQGLTRTLLGVGVDPADLPPGGGAGPGFAPYSFARFGRGGTGMTSYGRLEGYSSDLGIQADVYPDE